MQTPGAAGELQPCMLLFTVAGHTFIDGMLQLQEPPNPAELELVPWVSWLHYPKKVDRRHFLYRGLLTSSAPGQRSLDLPQWILQQAHRQSDSEGWQLSDLYLEVSTGKVDFTLWSSCLMLQPWPLISGNFSSCLRRWRLPSPWKSAGCGPVRWSVSRAAAVM